MAERIVSLLPSATEVLFFLGYGDRVAGVTFECDTPAVAAALPHVTNTVVPAGATPAEIDQIVRRASEGGTELYQLDRKLLAELDPDLIVSQDLCRVCALPSGTVDEAVRQLGCSAEVFSYDPMTLHAVFDEMAALARTVDPTLSIEPPEIAQLRERLAEVEKAVSGRHRPRVLLLEWTDPPFTPGHWIPDQIVAAGGEPVLAHPGGRSSVSDWESIARCGAEVLLVAPCGFDQAGAEKQLADVLRRPELADLPAVSNGATFAVDADGLIVRPGPRLVDGVEALARVFHPDSYRTAST